MYNTMESMNIAHCDVYTDTILCYAYSEAVVNSQHVTKVITVYSCTWLPSNDSAFSGDIFCGK